MEHTNPLDALFSRAAAHGVPMSRICKEAGIAPTTPSRWRTGKNSPMFGKIVALNEALDGILAQQDAAA
jgi:hypothetical protein